VVNGRLTERSFRRYRIIAPLIRSGFADLKCAAVQNLAYGNRFRALGTVGERIHVTGTMKWDTATIADHVEGADELAEAMGIDRKRPLIVAGSTAVGEHELLVGAMPEGSQLLCAPRKPEWFDQAAQVLKGCARRSRGECGSSTGRFLLDTIGELRSAYALADVVVVGRTFGDLHGSDMMEPIALGKATVVGAATADFQDTVDELLAGDALVQVESAALSETLRRLLEDPTRRETLARNGREVIRNHQGATDRHVDVIMSLLTSIDCKATSAKANPPS
jgi:3-deoxy-D-manno-octulosonic-acid transferase